MNICVPVTKSTVLKSKTYTVNVKCDLNALVDEHDNYIVLFDNDGNGVDWKNRRCKVFITNDGEWRVIPI